MYEEIQMLESILGTDLIIRPCELGHDYVVTSPFSTLLCQSGLGSYM